MATHLITVFDILSITIGTIGVAIIVWGVVLTLYKVLRLEFSKLKHKSIDCERELVRHKFAIYLLLGLEFLID